MLSPTGRAEWSAIVPGSGMVYIGTHHEPHTVSMMHQLHCLDIIRGDIVERNGTRKEPELVMHCLNYIKQMILCRGGLYLEPMVGTDPSPIGVHQCRDWSMIYREVEKNQKEYARSRSMLEE